MLEEIKKILCKYRQEHLLAYYDTLQDNEKQNLLKQILSIDFNMLIKINEVKQENNGKITPIKTIPRNQILFKEKEYQEIGLHEIRNNKIGLVLLAGGQGTRLGIDKPKGMLNVGINKDISLFNILINNILDVVKVSGNYLPLFIMTSNINNDDTIEFFKKNNYFGYDRNFIFFFIQEMVPACDFNGKILMESPSELVMSPNGNGGWFSSLIKAGLLSIIKKFDIEWLNIFSVDNVLQRIGDPLFIGAVIQNGYTSGAKVVKKVSPEERVGVICLKSNHPSIVEYYELSDEMRYAKDDEGNYSYNYGVTLNYLFRLKDLMNTINTVLPLHIVEKKIPFYDGKSYIEPNQPNGYKFELLILDMIELFEDCFPFEVIRENEFAPIKNATGNDSLETARKLLLYNKVEI